MHIAVSSRTRCVSRHAEVGVLSDHPHVQAATSQRRVPMHRAYAAGWWMDFELIYIGAGFITPLAVNISMMIGAILSWGIAWPLLENREGEWYPAGLASHSFRGLFACASAGPRAPAVRRPSLARCCDCLHGSCNSRGAYPVIISTWMLCDRGCKSLDGWQALAVRPRTAQCGRTAELQQL